MKPFIIILACLSIIRSTSGQGTSVIRGHFDFAFSKVAIQTDEDPVTGTRLAFEGVITDGNSFTILAELYGPTIYLLTIDDSPVAQFFLCPGENVNVSSDGGKFIFDGPSHRYTLWKDHLRSKYIDKYTLEFAAEQIGAQNIDSLISYLFTVRSANLHQAREFISDLKPSTCEANFIQQEIQYSIYPILWSQLLQRGYQIGHNAYTFIDKLDLRDTSAALTSVSYNRSVDVYIFRKLRLEQNWFEPDSFDPSSDTFNTLFYEKIMEELAHEDVRNKFLTRRIIKLLSSGSTASEPLFKRYLTDCSNPTYIKIALTFYNEYLKLKRISKASLSIESLKGSLFEKLKEHHGKILYLDFWASWCGPCLQMIPATIKLHQRYRERGVDVIYVNIDDNIGAAEATAKKLGLTGPTIYLNKEQSGEIRKRLQIQGMPHYILIDAQGTIVDADAPSPDSKTIEKQLNELVENR